MVITVTCPACSSSFPVDPAKIPEGGVNARCTSCSEVFRIEKPVEVEPVATLVELAPEPPVEATPPPLPPTPPAPAPPVAAEPDPPIVDTADDWVVDHEEIPAMVPDSLPDVQEPVSGLEVAEPDFSAGVEPEVAEPDYSAEPEPEVAAPDFAAAVEPAAAAAEPEVAPVADSVSEAEPEVPEPEVVAEVDAPPSVETSDPFAEPAPFEQAAPEEPSPAPAATTGVQGFTFGKRDPTDKAKRLARVLVSDMIMYNAERHQNALGAGTLVQDFEEEIDKSWKEYVEQVGDELANGPGRAFWIEALNDILAKGEQIF